MLNNITSKYIGPIYIHCFDVTLSHLNSVSVFTVYFRVILSYATWYFV